MKIKKIFYIVFKLAVLGVIPTLLSCTNGMTQNSLLSAKDDRNVILPNGNELHIEIENVNSRTIIVKFTNISTDRVFCAHIPGADKEPLAYLPYILERKKTNDDTFETYIGGGHYAPALHPIETGKTIVTRPIVLEEGQYRVKVNYLMDEIIANLVNEKIPEPGLTEHERTKVSQSYKKALSDVFTIPKS